MGLTRIHAFLAPAESKLLDQSARFLVAGGCSAAVYITSTTLLSVLWVPFHVALPIGWTLGVCVHFTLQRLFVWAHHERFALSLGGQVPRYLFLAGSQLGLTFLSTATLPDALGLPVEVVYIGTVGCLAVVNFVLFRHRVFRGAETTAAPAQLAP